MTHLLQDRQECFGESLIGLRVYGCSSILRFLNHMPEALKLVEANDNTDRIDESTKKMSAEGKEKKIPPTE